MDLETLHVAFASCAMDSIGQLPTTMKGNRSALTFICLLMSYLITVPLKKKKQKKQKKKKKTANEVSMAYIKSNST